MQSNTRPATQPEERVFPVDIASLQQPDGSFHGDQWGEVDTRFSYCALCCLSLLGRLDEVMPCCAFALRLFLTASLL